MLVSNQATPRLQGAAERLQQPGFDRVDDAEHAQLVMPTLQNPLVGRARQNFLQVPEAEALAGAIDRAQQLAGKFGGVDHAGSFETVVAVAASLWRILAEVPQQYRSPASRCLDQHRQRIEAGPLARLPALVDLAEPLPRLGEVAGGPQHHCDARIAVAPGTTGLLVIGLDRLRNS